MAVGIGNMFHVELPQNFNSPYQAASIMEFWERWHMSLTRFLRNYIYIPLGGNRKGKIRTYCNIMIVFLVSGIWHGANWTFILWGLLHGLLNCLNRLFRRPWEKLGKVTRWFLTFNAVNMLWVLFRADNIASAVLFLKRMYSLSDFSVREELYDCFCLTEWKMLQESLPFFERLLSCVTGLPLWIFVLGAFFIVLNAKNSKEREFRPTVMTSVTTVALMVWSVVSLNGISTFLYFGF